MSSDTPSPPALAQTALHALHLELGARMVPFAGYAMPVQYPTGVLQEHRQTRRSAGLFDVSHMGQLKLIGAEAAEALETLVPMDIVGLGLHRQRYALFTGPDGGILDDLMVTRGDGHLFVVVNASRRKEDAAHLRTELGGFDCHVAELDDHALLALQGPAAVDVLKRLCPEVDFASWTFMSARRIVIGAIDGIACFVTRSGYTGEDGFEISVENRDAEALARVLLDQPEVAPIGLGARDSLRLEAGLCLYGNDIDPTTTPIEGSLTWALSKARRAGGERAGGFPGADRILAQLAAGTDAAAAGAITRKRVGLVGVERTPVREHTSLVDVDGSPLGVVTSGTFGPTAERAVALGYLPTSHAAIGTEVHALVRGKPVSMRVTQTPFVPHRYHRG